MIKKNKVKTIIKNNLFGFILSALIFGPLGVYAATTWLSANVIYDNSGSGMSALNVQDAIDELYNAIPKAPEIVGPAATLLEKVVTSGDGLYAYEYEEGRYVYKGSSPANYITFNGEAAGWRIISLEADGMLKIIRNSSISNQYWDTSSSNNWTRPATLNTYLNSTYKNSIDTTYVQTHDFPVGAAVYNNTDLVAQITSEKATVWNGDIGLMSLSDYIRANTNAAQCGNIILNNTNFSTCATTNWIVSIAETGSAIYSSGDVWTMTAVSSSSINVHEVVANGRILSRAANGDIGEPDTYVIGVAPALYLKSDITLSGSGTDKDPYVIVEN